MCNSTGQRSVGAILYILGLLVAGVMFMVIGSEYNQSSTDYDKLKTYFWVYAISMLIGTIGLILDNGDRFCGEEEVKDVEYFGGLFQVVSGFAWAGLGVGLAHYYEANLVSVAWEEREHLAWLSGVAAIFYGFGALFTLKQLLCCEGFSCGLSAIFQIVNMVLSIMLIVFWFMFADKLSKDPADDKGDGDRRTFSYLLGVVYILMGLMGVLLMFGICSGGDRKKPVYGNDGYDDGYNNGGYDNGGGYNNGGDQGYGGNQGYGEETTTY